MADNYTILLPWLTSQGDTQSSLMSPPSSVPILPADRQHQYGVCPLHKIKINLSDFYDITHFIFYINSLQTVQILYAATKNNFQDLLTFYRFYHTTMIYLLLSYNINNFNNFNNFVPYKVKTP
jgi:hypothetical protein